MFSNSFHKKVPVILLNDIDKLGIAGQEKAVSRGHFRNVLAPQKLAVVATPSNRAKNPVADVSFISIPKLIQLIYRKNALNLLKDKKGLRKLAKDYQK